MTRLLPQFLVGVPVVVALVSCVVFAKEGGPIIAPVAGPPAGEWKVEFANGVTQLCDVFTFDGERHATVEEPQRRSRGRVEVSGGSVVMTFNDDRIERWTQVGDRFVVEHWFPGSRRATATPVLGIAERAR
jgi:hypothetical protein